MPGASHRTLVEPTAGRRRMLFRQFLMAALLALVIPLATKAAPIATRITTLSPVWSLSASVYDSLAPDNPAPLEGEFTYAYHLTALRPIDLYQIEIAWEGVPASNLGFVAGSGAASPRSFFQGQVGRFSGAVFLFGTAGVSVHVRLDALQSTDALFLHAPYRPGSASFTVQTVSIQEPGAFQTIGPSVPEPRIAEIMALSVIACAAFLARRTERHRVRTAYQSTRVTAIIASGISLLTPSLTSAQLPSFPEGEGAGPSGNDTFDDAVVISGALAAASCTAQGAPFLCCTGLGTGNNCFGSLTRSSLKNA